MSKGTANAGEPPLAEGLRRLLHALEASGRAILAGPGDELLQSIVEAAARLFGAAASSIALVDRDQQSLVFRVATGAGHDEVVGMRIPIDQGIAGYVAMTAQPLAVSNVQQDPRWAQQTAEKTGYVPRSILAMPLIYGERVLGVIEVLDKIAAPSFGMQDMELLGIFAHQAAIAIQASLQHDLLGETLVSGLRGLVEGEDAGAQAVRQALAEAGGEDSAASDLQALAEAFRAIAGAGPAERKACLQVLAAFAEYVRSRPRYA